MTQAPKADIDIERATYEDNLVRQHLPIVQYVVSEVAQRVPSHVSRSDLVSAGMLGLAQAARSYDPERGIAFDRFASTRIRGAMLDELRGRDLASRSVRAPQNRRPVFVRPPARAAPRRSEGHRMPTPLARA